MSGETAMPGAAPDAAARPPRARRRRRLFAIFALVVLALAIAAAIWWLLVGARHVSTDNAYVDADIARISALTAGAVADVRVRETQAVRRGDVLVALDPADARLALAAAEADYGRALRRVRQYLADNDAAAATVAQAQARLAQAATELRRRQSLADSGAVSDEELTTARAAQDAARTALAAARGQAASHAALTAGADILSNPEVQAAHAAVEAARLALARTTIRSPIDGVIAEKRAALGQRVQTGQPLMTVVPIGRVYVEANFKESQLRRVRPGQPVTLVSDLYGGDVVFHGRVVGLAGGTGAAFAVIPAQNATGNWIKVVQRVPVRIDLDAAELRAHPLRVGLSMTVDIDIRQDAD